MQPKRYPPKFKFQVVLELLQGEQSVGQLAKSYDVHPNSILKWKKESLNFGAADSGTYPSSDRDESNWPCGGLVRLK
jgi:transposase-like protein